MLLTLTGLWFSLIMPGLDRWSKRFFTAYFIVRLLCSVAGLGDTVLYRFPDLELLKQIFLFLEITALTLPLPMLAVYLLQCCGKTSGAARFFAPWQACGRRLSFCLPSQRCRASRSVSRRRENTCGAPALCCW